MLRKLLHERTWAKAFELTGLPVRRRHKNHIRLRIENDGTIGTETDCSDSDRNSEDSDRETDTTETYSNTSSTSAEMNDSSKIIRQNALDSVSCKTMSSSCTSCGSNFGYVRYFDTSKDMHLDVIQPYIKGDCTKNIFLPLHDINSQGPLGFETFHPLLQHSHSNENSSFDVRSYMACEDLVNMDQDKHIDTLTNNDSDYIPTRRSYPNCSAKNENVQKLWKSTEDRYSRGDATDSTSVCNLLQDLDPPSLKHDRASPVGSIILDPPPMFRNNDEDLKVMNVNLNTNVPFRKHSLNSDKKIRRSASRSMVETENIKKHDPHMQRMSSQSETRKPVKKCECCNRSLCPSPRSSDSGVAGSCNLASPELNMHEYPGTGGISHDSDSQGKTNATRDDYRSNQRKLTLSEIEAAAFEDQCRCTSPFGSTARTSCVTSVTSETSLDVMDSSNTFVTSTFAGNPPVSTPEVKRTSIRRNIERYVPEIRIKPEVPPRIYRKPSTHLEVPKNVRQPVPCQWSTLNITERTKPSLHYHMRIYREKPDDDKQEVSSRKSRESMLRNCVVFNKENRSREDVVRKTRSRSEDMLKSKKVLTEAQTGFVVYRSDLYAHWWMKAKLPITVVTDSGKDNFFVKRYCFVYRWFFSFITTRLMSLEYPPILQCFTRSSLPVFIHLTN